MISGIINRLAGGLGGREQPTAMSAAQAHEEKGWDSDEWKDDVSVSLNGEGGSEVKSPASEDAAGADSEEEGSDASGPSSSGEPAGASPVVHPDSEEESEESGEADEEQKQQQRRRQRPARTAKNARVPAAAAAPARASSRLRDPSRRQLKQQAKEAAAALSGGTSSEDEEEAQPAALSKAMLPGLTGAVLKEECKRLGIPIGKGGKAHLIGLLEAWLAENDGSSQGKEEAVAEARQQQRPQRRGQAATQAAGSKRKLSQAAAEQPSAKVRAQRPQRTATAAAVPPAVGAQQGGRSPTPAAAAPRLEMSQPPEAVQRAGAAAAGGAAQQQQAAQHVAPGHNVRLCRGARVSDPSQAASNLLLRRLTQPRSAEAGTAQLRPRLQEAYQSLLDGLTATVDLGHNNSLLVVGPRGSGKTLVVEHALAALQARWNTDPRDATVGIVRLSGLAHADERTAFSFIAKGLCNAWGHRFSSSASLADNIAFLRGMLAVLQQADKAAVFVLDEFDLWATKRVKQTVLYNLLDALQTSGIQAAVVGLSCRQDVVKLLEKRVKSRFSHRKVDLTLPTSVHRVEPRRDDDTPAAGAGGGGAVAQDGALDVLQAMLTLPPQFTHRQYAERWNASVAAAAASKDVQQALQRCINIYPSMRHLALIADHVLQAAGRSGQVTAGVLRGAVERLVLQAKAMVHAVSDLAVLDLIVLVAAARLAAAGKEDFNFEMAHSELQRYLARGGHADNFTHVQFGKGWDHLLSAGLVAFVDPRSEARVGSRHFVPAYLQVTQEEVEEGLRAHPECPQALVEWLKREGGLGTTAGQFL